MKSPIQFFTAIAILLATATVAAQVYKWVDKDGKVQYTDTPPPANASKTEAKKVDTPTSSGTGAAPIAAKSIDERAKDYDKRRADAAEKLKKDGESQKNADIDKENCRGAKDALRDLESGRPITKINDAGERNFMTDEQRQAEMTKAKSSAAASCKE